MLFLGTTPRGTIEEIPAVVWAQCAPQNELRAVRGLAGPVRRVSGLRPYVKLRLYYEVKDRLVWGWARRHHLVLASRQAKEDAVAFGVPRRRICVAPYPIDLDRFTPQPIPNGTTRRILCIGRLDPRKRVDLLVDAVALLATRRRDFHVEVIGRDGYIPGWSAFVERAAAGLPLTYTKALPQSEILERLSQADVLVQPSEREEFGHAVAEALACGVPVVTGPTNGTGEWAPTDGSVRFDRYEPQELADALDRALSISRDPEARGACRRASHAFAADRVAATLVQHLRSAKP
jgi:glycosyltransferase involved in cell wall biosynthesis